MQAGAVHAPAEGMTRPHVSLGVVHLQGIWPSLEPFNSSIEHMLLQEFNTMTDAKRQDRCTLSKAVGCPSLP